MVILTTDMTIAQTTTETIMAHQTTIIPTPPIQGPMKNVTVITIPLMENYFIQNALITKS